ncbi:BrnT family toxin [Parahaliea maris]|uniref:BrnT family toxin n=1 Tax=Parahaliea maris TaxID=2716870 RepID=A0A5C8ZSR9_9GAMM|nr:BrnT family toxin [Parahaliea maris]TXS90824.1 BrnT family toxin [Parahaliea maris]
MEFEWDEAKNQANQGKHGLSFKEAALVFKKPVLTRVDRRADYGEVRHISIGTLDGQIAVVVVHTDRAEVIRIISARLANRKERRAYHEYCQKIAR